MTEHDTSITDLKKPLSKPQNQKLNSSQIIKTFETAAKDCPSSSNSVLIFPWNLNFGRFEDAIIHKSISESNHFEPVEVQKVLSRISYVTNYKVNELFNTKEKLAFHIILMAMTILTILLMAVMIYYFYKVYWGFYLLLFLLPIAPLFVYIKFHHGKGRVVEGLIKRRNDIDLILAEFNKQTFHQKGYKWKTGDLGAWLELCYDEENCKKTIERKDTVKTELNKVEDQPEGQSPNNLNELKSENISVTVDSPKDQKVNIYDGFDVTYDELKLGKRKDSKYSKDSIGNDNISTLFNNNGFPTQH